MDRICKTCARKATYRGFCDACRQVPTAPLKQRRRLQSGRRPAHPVANTKAWRRLAKTLLQAEPYCKRCERMGHRRPATQVDHVLPARLFPEKAMDPDNTQTLCKRCHDFKSGGERRGLAYDYRRGVAYNLAEAKR